MSSEVSNEIRVFLLYNSQANKFTLISMTNDKTVNENGCLWIFLAMLYKNIECQKTLLNEDGWNNEILSREKKTMRKVVTYIFIVGYKSFANKNMCKGNLIEWRTTVATERLNNSRLTIQATKQITTKQRIVFINLSFRSFFFCNFGMWMRSIAKCVQL